MIFFCGSWHSFTIYNLKLNFIKPKQVNTSYFTLLPSVTKLRRLFLHLSVILSTGESASVHAGIPPPPGPGTPLGADTPLDQAHTPRADTPLQEQTPPGTRRPPDQAPTPWNQAPPRTRHPPRSRHPPREMATTLDGTHPTWMHSCSISKLVHSYFLYSPKRRLIAFAIFIHICAEQLFSKLNYNELPVKLIDWVKFDELAFCFHINNSKRQSSLFN